jgi:hypothetical protein
MAGELDVCALRQQTLATALATSRETGPTRFGAHAGTETVLLFAGAFRALKCAFHKPGFTAEASEERLP